MTFDEVLAQIVELLQREGRVTYRRSSVGLPLTTTTSKT